MATQPVDAQLRKTGIGVVGDVPWGTHFFMFYETKQDLLDTLVPYFKAGLETGELCLWLVSEPLTEEEARNALRQAVPEFGRYVADRSIEILGGRRFYVSGDNLDLQRAIRTWAEKTASALTRGYAGLRVSASTAWLERKDWNAFSDYESELNNSIRNWRMTDLCQWLWEEFQVSIARQTLSRELRTLGYRKLTARPRHHAQAEGAIEHFKKAFPPSWQKSHGRRVSSLAR